MQFIINKETILAPLQAISGLVDRRQTLPIIGNVLLEIHNNQLSMTTTNLEVELRVRIPLTVEAPNLQTTITARKFHDIISKLPDESIIECTLTDDQLKLHTPSVDVELTVISAEDFPIMKEEAIQSPEIGMSLRQDELLRIIEKTSFSMAIQDVRYFLNGMLFQFADDSLRVVATDGHRLAISQMQIKQDVEDRSVIVPRRGVVELVRIITGKEDLADITLQGNVIIVRTKQIEYKCKLVDGEYPNYAAVIPQDPPNSFLVDAKPLIDALDRTAIVLHERPKGTKMLLDTGKLTLQTSNALGERAKETINVDYQGNSVQLGYNTDYLLDAFGKIKTDRIKVSFNDPNESCLIEEVGGDLTRFVIMSMKV